jgi:hypothetical protein|tara:strand:- start:365 stop:595 length:231 start_codon:yes stop_codon:yes gene_type:complete
LGLLRIISYINNVKNKNKVMSEEKVELVNQLAFLVSLQEKVWQYHPNNPNAVSVVDEYAQLQMEIEGVEIRLEGID